MFPRLFCRLLPTMIVVSGAGCATLEMPTPIEHVSSGDENERAPSYEHRPEPSAAEAPDTAPTPAGSAADPARSTVTYVHPVIAEHGGAVALPDAVHPPDPTLRYRIVFDITASATDESRVNPGLDKVARFLNVAATAGVTPERMDLIAVLHGDATAAALSDEAHRRERGVANPNTTLVTALEEAGVEVVVCGQALSHRDIPREDLSAAIGVTLAALTLVPTLALQGYAVLPLR